MTTPNIQITVSETVTSNLATTINGVSVPAGTPFREAVIEAAIAQGYTGAVRVYLNGVELVNPNDAPEVLAPGDAVTTTPFDKAG